tara:strand:- start:1978 stop:2553 length:576 start_codon:yes stop_codon:yes gene_type:complete
MNEIIKKNSSKFGLISGGIAIAYFLAAYLIDEALFVNMILGIALWIAYIVFFILSVAQSKKALGGFISFKDAFSGFVLTAIIYSLLVTMFSIFLFNVMDPELGLRLKEASIEKSIEIWESIGLTDDQISESLEKMEAMDTYSISNLGKSFLYSIIGYSILGLIVAAIMKKDRPVFLDMEVDDFANDSESQS